jgi:hypothetical protein
MYLYELPPAKKSGTMRKVMGRATGNLVAAGLLAVTRFPACQNPNSI